MRKPLHSNNVMFADVNENCYKNFRMSYCCLGQRVSSLHTPECNRCISQLIDVSRTWKGYARRVLHRLTSYASDLRIFSPSEMSTSTTSTKRSASDSLLASSTPRFRPPTRKRPTVVRTDRDARINPTARDPWHL